MARGTLSELDASSFRSAVADAEATLPALPEPKRSALAAVLASAARHAQGYDRARAYSLFTTLRFSTAFLRARALPPRGRDVRDQDGVVYRSYGPGGLQFHALASFGRLNALAARRDYRGATRLAYALIARGRGRGRGLEWESFLRTSGGAPPWTSGLTQAVAAQAFARVGMHREARGAYDALAPRLLLRTSSGPWIRLYDFSGDLVLNAQLQAALSLQEYGSRVGDERARSLARQLLRSAAVTLGRFDTGSWSRYSLHGPEASLTYHTYVASLLWKLARRTGNPLWSRYAARFRRDWREPPRIAAAPAGPVVYPVPADGFRDSAPIRFRLSKPSYVTLSIAGTTQSRWLPAGAHTLLWSPGRRAPGAYAVGIDARDRAGNARRVRLPHIRVGRDTRPPRLTVSVVAGTHVRWRVADRATPWVALRIVVRRGGHTDIRRLRVHPGHGETRLRLDVARSWHVTVVATDSAGNASTRVLGRVGGLGRYPRVAPAA